MTENVNESEVARIQREIEEEVIAMHNGLTGLATVAKHETITHKYNSLGDHQDQLAIHIGEKAAITYVCELYIQHGK